MSGERDWADKAAIDLWRRLVNSDGNHALKIIAAELRLAKQQGKCEGVTEAPEAVKAAFAGAKPGG